MKKVSMGLLIVLGSIAVAATLFARPCSKQSIQSYVLRNQDELTNYARKVIEEHPMEPLEWNGWKVYYYSDGMVEFCTSSFGFVPSTTYKGFYYSEDDEPHGFQNVPVEFVKNENGWSWAESECDNLQSDILLLPALTAGFFCYLFPILIAFWKSLFLGTGTDFVGIHNYVDLFKNEAFSLAVRNLFHLWAIIVPVNLVIGIFIAEAYTILRQEKLCLFFLVPSILPAACVVTIASSILRKSPSQWGETPFAFYVFLVIVLWKTLGFSILIFMVAMKSIESEIIDAAMLDGVNPLQCFWYIKLPIIKSSLLICGILTIYNSFRCFREAYLIGGSHPNEQLYSIQHFLQNNFMNMNYARLEAASILVVIFVEAFVLSGMCLARKKRNN